MFKCETYVNYIMVKMLNMIAAKKGCVSNCINNTRNK